MCIRDRDKEFVPFAFMIGEDSLPHLVEDYQFKINKRDRVTAFVEDVYKRQG